MEYHFTFSTYKRPFLQPLKTHHGTWKVREGIIISLTPIAKTNKIGYGEIAPLSWFGSETLDEALRFCQQLGNKITTELINNIPDNLPACQFAFESAFSDLEFLEDKTEKLSYSYLLPTEELPEDLTNYHTFKYKIGVNSLADEIKIVEKLLKRLQGKKLRLDANGGLNDHEAKQWLQLANESEIIEFIEQPLSINNFNQMLELSDRYSTPIALDESVTNIKQLQECYQKGWRGIFVIKAAIAGSPQKLRQFCRQYQIDAVFSSVMETDIGRKAALRLAVELNNRDRAVGFGVNHWFVDVGN